jgi:hypothetical protein
MGIPGACLWSYTLTPRFERVLKIKMANAVIPGEDIALAMGKDLKFRIFKRDNPYKAWQRISESSADLESILLQPYPFEYFEVSIWLVMQDMHVMYWTSSDPQHFNSFVLNWAPKISRAPGK